jgi:hypothetical protein
MVASDCNVHPEHWRSQSAALRIARSIAPPQRFHGWVVQPPKEISHLAARYREPESSGLTATVSAKGPNDISLNLE